MKTAACPKILSLVLGATLAARLSLATPGIAQDRFYLIDLNSRTATELGSLGGGVTVAQPPNDLGQVAGYASSLSFITGPDGVGMTALDSVGGTYTYANAINNTGQVVGSSDIFASRAFITGPNGTGMRDLGTLGVAPVMLYKKRCRTGSGMVHHGGRGFARFHDRTQWHRHEGPWDAGW